MHRMWSGLGRATYFVSFPLVTLFLHKSNRSRLLVVSGNQVLVVKAWLGDGRWDLPGGGLHSTETPIDGALRELREETGLVLPAADCQSLGSWQEHHGKFFVTYHGLTIKTSSPLVAPGRRRLEITDIAWLPLDQLTVNNARPVVISLIGKWQA